MKKFINKYSFALIGLMVSVSAFAAGGTGMDCEALKKLHDVFNLLRTMAFIGSAFYIAGWAWKYISSGEAKPDDLKKQGQGLLVGFSLLFLIGVILSFIMSVTNAQGVGCADVIKGW